MVRQMVMNRIRNRIFGYLQVWFIDIENVVILVKLFYSLKLDPCC